MSKNVPVLTATTRRMPSASAASRTCFVPSTFTASKSGRFWLAPPRSAAQWMAASPPCGGPPDIVGVGDVAGDDLDPQGDERVGVGAGAGQGPHGVAALDQELADVGAGQPGGAGDEDRLAHAGGLLGDVGVGGVDLVGVVGDHRWAVPKTSRVWMKRCRPMALAQVKPSSMIWAAVKTCAELPVDLVVDGVVVGREQVEELHRQTLLLGQRRTRPGRPGRRRPRR